MEAPVFSRFVYVWLGQLISSIGTGITAFVLGVYVFHITGSAANYSLIIMASFAPTLLLKPFGGVAADRFNRRWLMIIGDAGAALGVLFIVVMLFLGFNGLWFLYVGTMVSSIFVAVQNPAYKASITDLVSPSDYTKASGLMQLAESSKYLISPAVAGVLMSLFPVGDVLLIDALSFLVAIIMVLFVKKKLVPSKVAAKAASSAKADFIEGVRYTFKDRTLVLLLLIISAVSFFVGIFQALLGPMVLSFAAPKAFGLSQTIMASGMLLSSLCIGVFGKSRQKIPLLSLGLCVVGSCFALLGLVPHLIYITTIGFFFFLALPLVNTSLDVLVRKNVENKVQGRVWAIVSLISQFGMVIALGCAGYLADHVFNPWLTADGALASTVGRWIGVGPGRGIGLVFVMAGLCVLLIGGIIFKTRRLQRLDSH